MAESPWMSCALILVCGVLGCGSSGDSPPPNNGPNTSVDSGKAIAVTPQTARQPVEQPPVESTPDSTTTSPGANTDSVESTTTDRAVWPLIEAIRRSPWDEAAILKLAEWYADVDPPRAELVRVQLELSPLRNDDPRRKELLLRQDKLLRDHSDRWTAALKPLGDTGNAEFDVGLIESIKIDEATDERLLCLLHVPEVRELWLEDAQLTSEGFELLTRLPQLDSLTITGDSISPADIERLKKLPPRTSIRLYFDELDEDAVERMNARRLAKFDMLSPAEQFSTGVRFASTFDSGLTYGRMMDDFNLSQSGLTDAKLRLLSRLTHLQGLSINETNITSEGLAVVAPMTELKHLSIGATPIESISRLSGLTKLESLFIFPSFGRAMGDSGLEAIENFTAMRDLYLSDDEASDGTVRRLAGMTKLEKLGLHIARLTDDSCLEALAGMTELKRLSIHTGNVSDAALQYVAGMKNLEQFDLTIDRGTGAGLRHLSGLTKLRRLGLGGDGVGDAGLEHLAGLKNLTAIVAQRSKVTPAGAIALAAKLPRVTILLDKHVVKSPRESYTFARYRAGTHVSALLPVDWLTADTPTAGKDYILAVEDGWKLINSYSGKIGPVEISLSRADGYFDTAKSADAAMKLILEERTEAEVVQRDVVEVADADVASCIVKEDVYRTCLTVAVKTDAGVVVLDCGVSPGRFDEFRDLFLTVARSLRVSARLEQHAEERVVIPVDELGGS